VELSRRRIAERRIEEAIAAADRAVALGGGPEALAARAHALSHARRFDAAARDLGAAVAARPSDGESFALLAVVEVNRGDDVEAAWAFGEARRAGGAGPALQRTWTLLTAIPPDPVHPQEALDRCTRGAAAALEGKWDEAQHEMLNGMRYSPGFEWCAAGIAETAWRKGDPGAAEPIYRRVIRNYRKDQEHLRADAKGKLAGVLLAAGRDPGEAAALARDALAVRGERAHLLDVLAEACARAEDVPCARDAARRLLARPHLPEDMRSRAADRLAAPEPSRASSR
jgi:predicted Zn-dependent protease